MASSPTIIVRLSGSADWHRTEDWRQLMGDYSLNETNQVWKSTHDFENDGEMHQGYISRYTSDNKQDEETGRWFVWFPSTDFIGDTRWAFYRTSCSCSNLWDACGGGISWERNDGEGLDETGNPVVKWVPDPELSARIIEPDVRSNNSDVPGGKKTIAAGTKNVDQRRHQHAMETATRYGDGTCAIINAWEENSSVKETSLAERVFGSEGSGRSEMECHVAMQAAIRLHARLLRENAAAQLPMDSEQLYTIHHDALLGSVRKFLDANASASSTSATVELAAFETLFQSANNLRCDLASTNQARSESISQHAVDELLRAYASDQAVLSGAINAAIEGSEGAGKFIVNQMERMCSQFSKVACRPASDADLCRLLTNVAAKTSAHMVADRTAALVALEVEVKAAKEQADRAETELSKHEAEPDSSKTPTSIPNQSTLKLESEIRELKRQLENMEASALATTKELDETKAELQEVQTHLNDEITHRRELDEMQKQLRNQQKTANAGAQSRIPRIGKRSPKSPSSSINNESAHLSDEIVKVRKELESERKKHTKTKEELKESYEQLKLLETEISTLESDYRERFKAQHRKSGIPGVSSRRRVEEAASGDPVAGMKAPGATVTEIAEVHFQKLAAQATAAQSALQQKLQQSEVNLENAKRDAKEELAKERAAATARFREREAVLLDHLSQASRDGNQQQSKIAGLEEEVDRLKAALAQAENQMGKYAADTTSLEEEKASLKVRERQLQEWLEKAEKEYKSRHDTMLRLEEEGADRGERYRKRVSETKSSVKRFVQSVEEKHHQDKANLATLLASAHSSNASEHGTFASHLDSLTLDIDAMNESVRQLEASFVSSDAAEIKHSKTVGSFLTIQALTKRTQKQHLTVKKLEGAIQEEKDGREDLMRRHIELGEKYSEETGKLERKLQECKGACDEKTSALEKKLQESESELRQLHPVLVTMQGDLEKLQTVAEDRKTKVRFAEIWRLNPSRTICCRAQ